MWACLCVRVNGACSYVSVLMCVCVCLCVHVYEWICKHVHDGSMSISEWMWNRVHFCEPVNVCIYFWVNTWVYVYVWMLIRCMYMTVLMRVPVSLWAGSLSAYVNIFMSVCKWLCEYISVIMFLCLHECVSLSCMFMNVNLCFAHVFLYICVWVNVQKSLCQ